MRRFVLAAFLAAACSAAGTAAQAGAIENACMNSERRVSRALCGCIQQVADITLTRSDQRLAAKFFKDPQKAQDMRQSSGSNGFWQKYKNFGATAEAYCSAG